MIASGGVRLGGRGTEQKRKRTMVMDNSVVIAGGQGGIRGLKGNVKKNPVAYFMLMLQGTNLLQLDLFPSQAGRRVRDIDKRLPGKGGRASKLVLNHRGKEISLSLNSFGIFSLCIIFCFLTYLQLVLPSSKLVPLQYPSGYTHAPSEAAPNSRDTSSKCKLSCPIRYSATLLCYIGSAAIMYHLLT